MSFTIPFLLAFLISFSITPILRIVGLKIGAYVKKKRPRDIHKKKTPRLGGFSIFLPFFILILVYFPQMNKHILGLLLASSLIMATIIFDDVWELSWQAKLFWQIIAVGIIIAFGIGIKEIANPFGGFINLNNINIPVLKINGIPYHLTLWSDLFTLIWIVGLMNVVNFLDGIDGLASGVSVLGFIVLFLLSLKVGQMGTALICIILAGGSLGLLPYNFNPAIIFLGDSGAYFLGFILGVLAIISGGKVATTLLILGIPILDGIWVVIRRIFKKNSPFLADKKHLHHQLLKIGLSQRQIVIFYYLIVASFGFISLSLKSKEKLIALLVLFFLMVLMLMILALIPRKKIFS